jgi:thiamine thiazole synthase
MEKLETKITRYIIKYTSEDWARLAEADIVIVGAGPAGMTAARYLSEKGYKTVVFERRLSFGGGIGGGGMLFHKLVMEKDAKEILNDFNINYQDADDDLCIVDSAELMAKLAVGAIDSGVKIVHGITVDDVIYRDNPLKINGVAIQWTSVLMSGLHVDPLFIYADAVVDATGHDAEVLTVAARKIPELNIMPIGEKSAYAEKGEKLVVEKTGKVVDGLYVAGMAVATLYGLPRMGPIFGGMLMSGKRVADIIDNDLRG